MADTAKKKKNSGIFIIIAAFALMTVITLLTGTTKVKWTDSLELAQQAAIKNNKPVLAFFFTKNGDELAQSNRMAIETLTSPDIARYVNKTFNPVRLDRDKNSRIANVYDVKRVPTMVIITADGKYNMRLEGFISEVEFYSRTGNALKQLATRQGESLQ